MGYDLYFRNDPLLSGALIVALVGGSYEKHLVPATRNPRQCRSGEPDQPWRTLRAYPPARTEMAVTRWGAASACRHLKMGPSLAATSGAQVPSTDF